MNKFAFVTLALVVSFSSFAKADMVVGGKPAQLLASALKAAGAFFDGHMGSSGTEAFDVQCIMKGNSVNKRTYQCSLEVQSNTGDMKKISVSGRTAKSLFDGLTAAGLQSDCGMGTCGVSANTVVVTIRGNDGGKRAYEAGIVP